MGHIGWCFSIIVLVLEGEGNHWTCNKSRNNTHILFCDHLPYYLVALEINMYTDQFLNLLFPCCSQIQCDDISQRSTKWHNPVMCLCIASTMVYTVTVQSRHNLITHYKHCHNKLTFYGVSIQERLQLDLVKHSLLIRYV